MMVVLLLQTLIRPARPLLAPLGLAPDAVRRALLSLRADGKDYALRGELADADALADIGEAVRREGAELKGKGKKTLSKALKAAAAAGVATGAGAAASSSGLSEGDSCEGDSPEEDAATKNGAAAPTKSACSFSSLKGLRSMESCSSPSRFIVSVGVLPRIQVMVTPS